MKSKNNCPVPATVLAPLSEKERKVLIRKNKRIDRLVMAEINSYAHRFPRIPDRDLNQAKPKA